MNPRNSSPYKVQTNFEIFQMNGLIPLVQGDKNFLSKVRVDFPFGKLILRKTNILTLIQNQFQLLVSVLPDFWVIPSKDSPSKNTLSPQIWRGDHSCNWSNPLVPEIGPHSKKSIRGLFVWKRSTWRNLSNRTRNRPKRIPPLNQIRTIWWLSAQNLFLKIISK